MSTKNGTNHGGTGRGVGSELIYLTEALKAQLCGTLPPGSLRGPATKAGATEACLAASLERAVAARDSHGAEGRIRAGAVAYESSVRR